MILASGATAAALPVLTFLGGAPGLAAQPPDHDCGQGGAFVVPGTDDLSHLHTRGVETRYTGQGYTVHRVDYPATFWPLGAQSYDANIETGKAVLADDVATYQRNCPGKPVVIVGYSQGARIAGDVLADIAAGNADGIDPAGVSGELYSDPRRRGSVAGAGTEVNLINAFPGAMLDGARGGDFADIPVYSVCIAGDPICDLPDLRRDPLGALDALLGFWVKHTGYDAVMATGPDAYEGLDDVTVIEESDGARVVVIAADPSLTTVLAQVGLPNLLRRVIIDVPYTDLAVLQPISRAILGLLPALPELGHGAHLSDLYAFRDALAGDPAAWASIFGSAMSVVNYPANFVRDWITVIDAVLDQRDPDLGFIAAPTVRTLASAGFAMVSTMQRSRTSSAGPTPAGPSTDVIAEVAVEGAPVDGSPAGGEVRTESVTSPAPVTEPSTTAMSSPGSASPGGRHRAPEATPGHETEVAQDASGISPVEVPVVGDPTDAAAVPDVVTDMTSDIADAS